MTLPFQTQPRDPQPRLGRLRKASVRGIRVDRVGYGRSDPRTSGSYTTESNAAELIDLREEMDLRGDLLV